ncbi:hypothetical protein GCM10028801_29860 [Nocardioides maradonensis]
MGSDSGDVVGIDVDHLDRAGRTTSGRGDHAATTAARLHGDLEAAHSLLGHPEVGPAMAAFVSDNIAIDAHHLGKNITAGGHGVSRVAATGRSSDNEGARDLSAQVQGTENGSSTLLKSIN